MSKRVYVRAIRPEEAEIYYSWGIENQEKSEFDPMVAMFASSTTWCAFDESGPIAYQTLQTPVMIESLAPRPDATPLEVASALKELTQNAITHAFNRGSGEVYFVGSDEETNNFAANKIFELVVDKNGQPMRLFRVKLKDLEGTDANINPQN